jgi:hypothetical protein
MIRFFTRWCFVGVMVCAVALPAYAQKAQVRPVSQIASAVQGELHGLVEDEKGQPLPGAVVSALGSSSVFAVSGQDGRFSFRNLPAGPYLVRAHLQGFAPLRGRIIQVSAGTHTAFTLSLARVDPSETPVLTAGVGGGGDIAEPAEENVHEHDEVAWRLRHAKRSVLKDAEQVIAGLEDDDSAWEDSLAGLGRAVGGPARFASALFAELDGQINLLTTTSFDRPQDLFMMGADSPRSAAYVSFIAPGTNGDWLMRGTITQGDLASWILTGSYRRNVEAAHAYEAGLSYSMQRYLGGNGEALLAIRDGSRNVGAIFAYDNWEVTPRLHVGYGARYARYDYLSEAGLVSPRASVTIQPAAADKLTLRATVSHRETAPGAEEFTPPAVGLWLPPERTFSHVSHGAFRSERLDHVEIAAEREFGRAIVIGVRAFRQEVDDQVMTLFRLAVAETDTPAGHYRVGSAGDVDARGWGVSVSRTVGNSIRASVDYTQVDPRWHSRPADTDAIVRLAGPVLPHDRRIHDLTASIDSIVAPTATRLFVVYKMNDSFAGMRQGFSAPIANARFNVEVRQDLPFLNFASGQWEMIAAVSNLFRDDPLDGSVYDELLVVRPPTRVLGGVTVRF